MRSSVSWLSTSTKALPIPTTSTWLGAVHGVLSHRNKVGNPRRPAHNHDARGGPTPRCVPRPAGVTGGENSPCRPPSSPPYPYDPQRCCRVPTIPRLLRCCRSDRLLAGSLRVGGRARESGSVHHGGRRRPGHACQVTDTGGVDDQLLQPDRQRGPGPRRGGARCGGQGPRVHSRGRLRAQHQGLRRPGLRPDHPRRLPAGRRHPGVGQGEPRPEVRHRRRRLLRHASRSAQGHHLRQRRGDDLRHRPGRVPRRLRGGGHVEVRQGRHLRRHQHPHRHHLHGRVPRRRRSSTTRTTPRTSRSWAGTARTASSPATSTTRTRASRPPSR